MGNGYKTDSLQEKKCFTLNIYKDAQPHLLQRENKITLTSHLSDLMQKSDNTLLTRLWCSRRSGAGAQINTTPPYRGQFDAIYHKR